MIPELHYLFIVRNQGQTKSVEWFDNSIDHQRDEADPLYQLAKLLIEMINAKPEVKRLPALKAGCI